MFVLELAPGKSTIPQRHLYEDVYYVLEGHGSTQIEFDDGQKRGFEWGPKSLFSIPLNAKHRHFNGSGTERALLATTTNLPMIMNVFHNERFVFDTPFDFIDRAGKSEYFAGEGDLITVRPGNHMWETNFVTDLAAIELKSWGDRGAGGTNIMFVLADGIMHAHISEMPVGTYKKGHRHGPSFHVMCVTGHGYSLLWFEGQKDFLRVDWKHGDGISARRPTIPSALQHQQSSGTLSGDCRWRPALSADGDATACAARQGGPKTGRVAQPEGRRRANRIRGSGSAHPSHLARGNEKEQRNTADGTSYSIRFASSGERIVGITSFALATTTRVRSASVSALT